MVNLNKKFHKFYGSVDLCLAPLLDSFDLVFLETYSFQDFSDYKKYVL